jgi:hypothetical protein
MPLQGMQQLWQQQAAAAVSARVGGPCWRPWQAPALVQHRGQPLALQMQVQQQQL